MSDLSGMSNTTVSVPLHVLRQLLQGSENKFNTSNGSTNRGGRGNGRGGNGHGPNGRGPNGHGKPPCRFFQQGNCRKGINCKFAHVGQGEASPTRVQSVGQPCRHHMRYGCKHETNTGTPCMLPHPECPMIAQNGECSKDINCVQGCPTRSRAVYAQRQANIRAAAASSQPVAGQPGVE